MSPPLNHGPRFCSDGVLAAHRAAAAAARQRLFATVVGLLHTHRADVAEAKAWVAAALLAAQAHMRDAATAIMAAVHRAAAGQVRARRVLAATRTVQAAFVHQVRENVRTFWYGNAYQPRAPDGDGTVGYQHAARRTAPADLAGRQEASERGLRGRVAHIYTLARYAAAAVAGAVTTQTNHPRAAVPAGQPRHTAAGLRPGVHRQARRLTYCIGK